MSQRTGRKVGADKASLPAHGKKAKQANMMQPGVPQEMGLGDGSATDHSGGNDGSKAPASAPKGAHKGPGEAK